MSKPDGGPAFPSGIWKDSPYGMSIRDYFAAKASDNDISEIMARIENTEYDGLGRINTITRQQARYIHADAMLEARK